LESARLRSRRWLSKQNNYINQWLTAKVRKSSCEPHKSDRIGPQRLPRASAASAQNMTDGRKHPAGAAEAPRLSKGKGCTTRNRPEPRLRHAASARARAGRGRNRGA